MFKRKEIIDKTKNKFKKHKKSIFIGLGCLGAFLFPVSIYFTQTAYFYNMSKIEKKEFKNLDTIYSYNASISSRYKRTIPSTYKTNIPLERYAWYDNPWYKANYKNDELMKTSAQALIAEAKWMMDDDYLKNEVAKRTLKKHPSADYQYGYDRRIPNSAPAVVKNFNVDLLRSGSLTTGLYIPPGEIVKINFKNLTDEQVKNMNVNLVISDNEFENYELNHTTAKKDQWFHRMPIVRKSIKIDKSYFEFGTPFGGLVNLFFTGAPLGEITNVGVSIKGAIEALHYVHGYTTEEEWYRLVREAKAPVAEIASDYISFVTPKYELSNFRKVNDKTPAPNPVDPKYYPYKSMSLINKLALDGHYTIDRAKTKVPKIRFLTTTWVRVGSAFATPNAWYVVQPLHWVHNILDYENFLNYGYWGTMHEMNHHNQDWFAANNEKWGFTDWGESSNNAITLASYIKYSNLLSNRDGLENRGEENELIHEHKLNGYIAQRHLSYRFNSTWVEETTGTRTSDIANNTTNQREKRKGIDADYSSIMGTFGAEGFQETVRSFKNNTIKNPFGGLVEKLNVTNTIAGDTENRMSARFIYKISQITGYNWSQYYLDTGLISEQDATMINTQLQAISNKLKNNASNLFKPYIPLYSFYATDVKYDSTSNISKYRKVATPFLISKKYFDSGYNFKLEELLETPKKVTIHYKKDPNDEKKKIITKKDYEDIYSISNVQLVNGPKYGKMVQSTNENSKKVYNYKPDLNNIDKIDEFEYSADVERKTTVTPTSGTKDLLKDQNQKITVNFKVKIRLDGNNNIEIPDNLEYEQYKPDFVISEFDKLQDIVMDNPIVNGKPTHQYWNDKETTEKNLLQKLPTQALQVKPNDSDIVLNLSFNDYADMNSFTFWNSPEEGVPHKIKIEDLSNPNSPKIVLETLYLSQQEATYFFPMVRTNKLRITFLKDDNATTPKRKWLKLKRIDFGMKDKGENILPANSQLIQTVGDWRKGFGGARYNKDSLLTINPFTSIYLGVRNTDSLSIFGTKDKNYGKFDVYVDNRFYKTVDTSSNYRSENTALTIVSDIKTSFGDGDHVVKLVSKSSKPIEIQGFNMDNGAEAFYANASDPYYILVSVIPLISIILIAAIAVVTTFILVRKKRKVKK